MVIRWMKYVKYYVWDDNCWFVSIAYSVPLGITAGYNGNFPVLRLLEYLLLDNRYKMII